MNHTPIPWKAHFNVPTATIPGHIIKADHGAQTPIAYGNGTSGGVYHPDCWFKHADEHFGNQRTRAFLGNLYYRGAEKKELRGVTCPYCRKGFTL